MLIAGLATGFVFMPITATVLAGVEPEHAGAASGLLQTTQQLGSAVGVAVIVSVYAAARCPASSCPGARAAFLTSAAFALAGPRGGDGRACATRVVRRTRSSSTPDLDPELRRSWPRPPDDSYSRAQQSIRMLAGTTVL